MYGLQDYEIVDPIKNIKSLNKLFDKHINSILRILHELTTNINLLHTSIESTFTSKTIPAIYPEKLRSFNFDESTIEKLFFDYIMLTTFSDLSENHYLRSIIEQYIKDLFHNKLDAFSFFNRCVDDIKKEADNRLSELEKLTTKKIVFFDSANQYYDIDFFYDYCYIWSYYTFVLILNNPTVSSYDIIKTSCYQSSNLDKMKEIYSQIKSEIEYSKNYSTIELFDTDYIIKQTINLEKKEINFDKLTEKNPTIDRNKLIYIKITNFILLNCYYNRIDNKYLLYRVIEGCSGNFCLKKMIPEKVNEILDKLTYNNKPLTKELILYTIKNGINIVDLNANILQYQTYKDKLKKYKEKMKALTSKRDQPVAVAELSGIKVNFN
jgi:hypothetical protein